MQKAQNDVRKYDREHQIVGREGFGTGDGIIHDPDKRIAGKPCEIHGVVEQNYGGGAGFIAIDQLAHERSSEFGTFCSRTARHGRDPIKVGTEIRGKAVRKGDMYSLLDISAISG